MICGYPPDCRARAAATLCALVLLGACTDRPVAPDTSADVATLTDRKEPSSSAKCDVDNGGLTLPPGFCAVVVTKEVGRARHMAVRPNGDLYVAIDNNPTTGAVGAVLALRDTDGDGRADIRQRFGPTGGNGLAWGHGQLFFAPDDRVLRYSFTGSELVPTATPAIVVSGLTASGDHHRKTVELDQNGGMFVNIGSATNSCQVVNRTDFSPGRDPCPELNTRAGVWRFSATGTGQSQTLGARFAKELRNMNALAVNPADGKLYGAQNGRDQLADNWGNLFTELDDAVLPAEELFVIEQGKPYGWPYCFYDGFQKKKVLAPEYGGDGKRVGRCDDRQLPIAIYPAHWAPLGMHFYSGSQFPSRYKGGLFIAWHGSRFNTALQPAGPGYVVTFNQWVNGKPVAQYETFANGFAGPTPTPTGAAHRPVDVTEAPDGSLYISDDKGGWLWRVFYVGTARR